MYSVVVLWAPDSADNRRTVEAVERALEQQKVVLTVRSAAEATIADVTAADIVVFGTQRTASADAPADFSELLRIFKGISLAGRTAGFFSMGPEKATQRLPQALNDTEIALMEDDPLFADQKMGFSNSVTEWAQRLMAVHQEMHNARA
jgi:hypothetical protein